MQSQKAIILIFTFFLPLGISAQSFQFENLYSTKDHPKSSESIILLQPQKTRTFNSPISDAEKKSSLFSTDRLELPLGEQRFNLNFLLVDPCAFSANANTNLYLIRNGYDPYYHNTNYIPSFTETIVCTAAKSLVRNFMR